MGVEFGKKEGLKDIFIQSFKEAASKSAIEPIEMPVLTSILLSLGFTNIVTGQYQIFNRDVSLTLIGAGSALLSRDIISIVQKRIAKSRDSNNEAPRQL